MVATPPDVHRVTDWGPLYPHDPAQQNGDQTAAFLLMNQSAASPSCHPHCRKLNAAATSRGAACTTKCPRSSSAAAPGFQRGSGSTAGIRDERAPGNPLHVHAPPLACARVRVCNRKKMSYKDSVNLVQNITDDEGKSSSEDDHTEVLLLYDTAEKSQNETVEGA
ncbi:hypothetical protein NDU88_006306 [Pleurodeles waltl]|uniref:Uncharacterized protein n=1 Tax=Pleurodeles waltl TaxID=8319 RepID=A0AAV7TXZ9_PLEWA|nr:hypothetical protein NDU88_006306 [Pleurodeles waltl]